METYDFTMGDEVEMSEKIKNKKETRLPNMHLYLIGSKRKALLYLNGAGRRRVSTVLEHLNLNMVLRLGGWLEGIVCSRR